MPQRLVLVALCALPLVAIACGGPSGLTALGSLAVHGTAASGPWDATFDFPTETRIDGGAGLTAMCTVTQTRDAAGAPIYGAVVDFIVPASAGSPLDSVTLMATSDATTGTIEADVGGEHFSNAACSYTMLYVGGDGGTGGSLNLETASDCTLTGSAGGTLTLSSDLVLRGCTLLD